MSLETFSKSRAQEMSMKLINLRTDLANLLATIDAVDKELQERCPHPDEFVKVLDTFKRPHQRKSTVLLYCSLCNQTKTKKGD